LKEEEFSLVWGLEAIDRITVSFENIICKIHVLWVPLLYGAAAAFLMWKGTLEYRAAGIKFF
jgi:hypothetical protein